MNKALVPVLVLVLTANAHAQNRTMVFASKAGVCGDGETFISMGRDDEGRETSFTQTSRGFNTTVGSHDYRNRTCNAGPVIVEITETEAGVVTDIETRVGRRATINTSTRAAADFLLDIAENSRVGTVAKHALLPVLLADSIDPAPRLLAIGRNTNVTREARKSAIFWVAQTGSPAAFEGLKALVNDRDSEIGKQAVFGLSQIKTDASATALIAAARNENLEREVRKSAIFWLGQAAGEKATRGLTDILSDGDVELKKQAVFALSQMKTKESMDALISVVKTSKDREVRKSALFWLGQSNDPRVLALFEDILLKD